MSRTARAMLLAAIGGLAAGAARADVIYTFNGTSSFSAPYGGGVFTPLLTLSLDITNAAVQSGSFTLSGSGGRTVPAIEDYSGDVAQWISASGNVLVPETLSASVAPSQGQFRLALTFDPATGAVTSTSFESAWGAGVGGALNGTGNIASGYIGSDAPPFGLCGPAGAGGGPGGYDCAVSGTWAEAGFDPSASPVPEPTTLAVLGAGLLGFAAIRGSRSRHLAGEA
jgi:hypothetical protein